MEQEKKTRMAQVNAKVTLECSFCVEVPEDADDGKVIDIARASITLPTGQMRLASGVLRKMGNENSLDKWQIGKLDYEIVK